MTYAEQREKELQKYRDILKHRDLTPDEDEKYMMLVTEKLDEKKPSIEECESLLQNIQKTGICAVYIDAPCGIQPPDKNEFITMLERKCQHARTNDAKIGTD